MGWQKEYLFHNKKSLFIASLILLPLPLYLVLLFVVPLPRKLNTPSFGKIIRYRDGRIMRMYVSSDEKWRFYTPLSEISDTLIRATIAYEDRYFYYHLGINPVAIFRALWVNLRQGKVVQGGSTLSMQLARILEPKKRTLLAKIIEAFRANQMELRLGKRKILEAYFNFAPYGGNVEGIKAASLFYLGKMPHSITSKEAAFLVAIPQSPTKRMPIPRNKDRIKRAMKKVASAMYKGGLITQQGVVGITSGNPAFYVRRPILEAPHAADFISLMFPDSQDILSAIDRNIQNKVFQVVQSYRDYINYHGAQDVSVVVIENSTRKVRALIGSFDYFNSHGGYVLGFYCFRSPGSTLKPFLYALSIQKGVITPLSLLPDAPLSFSKFEPKDFDMKYRGLVKAQDALSQSLNIPFVYLLRETGYKDFIALLNRGGLEEPVEGRYYGLPVITGGREVRLIDLTNMYVSLARGGQHADYILLEKNKIDNERELLKAGSVYLTLASISKRNRPDKPVLGNLLASEYGPVFWKTGTSFGRRDALSIGFREHYTVGVWVGNFDGRGGKDIVGAILAAPLMFDILKSIDGGYFSGDFPWKDKALSELTEVDVCAFSGYKPTENCHQRVKTLAMREQLPYKRCPYHKLYKIEKKTGYRACPQKEYKKNELKDSIFVVLPSPIRKVLGDKYSPPAFSQDCRTMSVKKGLFIVSPTNNAHYFVAKDVNFRQAVVLLAFTDSKFPELYWFIDGRFYMEGKSGETLTWQPVPGMHRIYVQDRDGRSAQIIVTVENSSTS